MSKLLKEFEEKGETGFLCVLLGATVVLFITAGVTLIIGAI